jgi:hypothetical protein
MLALQKIFASPSPSFWEIGARSAVWEAKDYPGIWIRRAEDHQGKLYWRMFAAYSQREADNHPHAGRVAELLHGQRFQTRRETVEAVEAALLALQA